MSSILVVNSTSLETRVALIEDGHISEFYLERRRDRRIVGNIYKGRVLRVLPGMQASFVDIGQEKAAFLYVSDVLWPDADAPIEARLTEGQQILVQVAKEPIGTKGARVTGHISLPGRYLVHMPTMDHVGISRRIVDADERERLRTIVLSSRKEGAGFIVRTASEGVEDDHLRSDIAMLLSLWEDVSAGFETSKAPQLIHAEPDLVLRATRDLFATDLDKLVVDSDASYELVSKFVERFMPEFASRVELYTGAEPIFDAYGIEIEVARALSRKVWLKSGGYIVIDHTEALAAIDVNTGKYVGNNTLEDTIFKINLEAVDEIVYQLRLRSIGGIIIIDFIDMETPEHREAVNEAFLNALKRDKAKTNVLKISEFGLVEMTRKRVRESVVQYLCDECPYCEGKGYVKSRETVAHEIIRELRREAPAVSSNRLTIVAHPDVASLLNEQEVTVLRELERNHQKAIDVVGSLGYHIEQFEVTA